MTKTRRMSFLLLLLPCALTAPAAAQTLQLADGQVLLAKVEDASGEGLRVQRLDNGGVLELTWDHLSPDCALRIKRAHALAGDDQGEPTTTAVEVRYNLGGTPKTVIGVIKDDPDEMALVVQQRGVPYRVRKENIVQLRKIDVPVSQVLTPDEYYAQQLADRNPGDEADLHKLLAEDLMRVRDYPRALQHLKTAQQLGNSREPERIVMLQKRVELYIEASKEREVLDDLQVATARAQPRDFKKGRELIARYQKEFANGKLKSEFEGDRKRFEEARTRYYSQKVAVDWRDAIRTIADRKMAEATTLSMAREYADNKMSEDIAAYVAQRNELEVEEVQELFAIRDKYPLGRRSEHYSYGIGSWVLGEAEILKGTKQGAEKDKGGAVDPDQQKELDRIRRALQKLQQNRGGGGGGGGGAGGREQTDEDWWAAADRGERGGWLRAYYAEHSGKLVMVNAYVQPCFSCAGIGTQTELDPQTNKPIKVPCYLCHGTKWLRTFKAY